MPPGQQGRFSEASQANSPGGASCLDKILMAFSEIGVVPAKLAFQVGVRQDNRRGMYCEE